MNLKEALAAIKQLENGADLVSAVESEFETIKAKNYEIIGEKRTETQKKQAYESALSAIAQSLGIEGDIEAILSSAAGKAQAIATELQQTKEAKTTAEQKLSEFETKVKTFERKDKFSQAAKLAGASAEVLERLLSDRFDDLKIDGDKVKLGEKELKEAIAEDASLKLFEASLFPTTTTTAEKKNPPKLSDTPPAKQGGNTDTEDPLVGYITKTYAVPKQGTVGK